MCTIFCCIVHKVYNVVLLSLLCPHIVHTADNSLTRRGQTRL